MKQRQVGQHRFDQVSTSKTRSINGNWSPNGGWRKRGLAGLLGGASVPAAALALSFAPHPARAQQAVNGTPTVVFGASAPSRLPTQDSFNVTANEALIDWAVTDPAVFLNAATTLDFSRDGGAYTVLNRVVSSPSLASTLALNGRIQSDTQGQIWFYNPGGWAVGAGATIDVGSLLLTASPVTIDPLDPDGAPRFLGDNGEIRLGQATVAGARIAIDPLANITSRGDSSYIALVAPRVVQAGTVTAGGSVAYVGAEAADITINAGLFDIDVTAGTTDPNGVVHTGTTTGPSSFGSTPRTQFLVSVGKNDAVTMLVSGQLGYDAASSAGFVDGRIVLSSGQGITSNAPAVLGSGPGKIELSAATLRNDLTATASDGIAVSAASAAQSVRVTGNAALTAGSTVDVAVSGTGAQFQVQGDLDLSAARGAQGGAVKITLASGGALRADNLTARADGFGRQLIDEETGVLVPGALGEAAQGGSVALSATDAVVEISSATQFSADARGGIGGASAGSAQAGTVSLVARNSSVLLGEGGATLNARALAANDGGFNFLVGTTGAASRGGSVTFDLSGGTILAGISLDNSAFASSGIDGAAQAASTGTLALSLASGTFTGSSILLNSDVLAEGGGAASGGPIGLTLSGASLTLDGGINLFGRVEGDVPATLGAAGSTSLRVGSGSSLSLFNLSMTRLATGTAAGKVVTAGNLALEVSGGSSLATSNGISLRSEGRGALSSDGPGGSGTGGAIDVTIDDSTLTADSSIIARSTGVAGGSFSEMVTNETGRGGAITLTVNGASSLISAIGIDLASPGRAFFGEGTLGGTTGIGGSVAVAVNGGTLTSDVLGLSATGQGGDGTLIGDAQVPQAGGTGRGGSVGLTIGGGTVQAGSVNLDAGGKGGFGANTFSGTDPAGRGGDAFGGDASLVLTGGTLATDDLAVGAGGNVPEVSDPREGEPSVRYFGGGGDASGDGGVAGAGGSATGGITRITVDGGALTSRNGSSGSGATPLSIRVDATGYGGNGGSTGEGSGAGAIKGDGGLGTGGTATFELLSGSTDFFNLTASAAGAGGIGGFQQPGKISDRLPQPTGTSLGADGGDGRGGNALVRIATDLEAFDSSGARRLVIVDATGAGGNAADGEVAGNGGNGFGGNATLEIDGATVALIDPSIDATGSGGSGGQPGLSNPGGDGGAGFGGNTALSLLNGATFTLTGGALLADGIGADGRTGSDGGGNLAPGNGGNGGDAKGGTATLRNSGGSTLDLVSGDGGTLRFSVTGSAGNGGLGGSDIRFEGNSFGNGGAGGSGMGGGIVVEANDSTLDLGAASFDADGFGGNGGDRVTDDSGAASEFSAGGDGGEGTGGSIRLTASGEGAALNFTNLDASANGTAGSGADGQGVDRTSFAGAPGGTASAGTGGSIILEAVSGGALTVRTSGSSAAPGRVTLEASGFGGVGGGGANGGTNPVTGVGGNGGNGGNSGQGNGGSVAVRADGGTISAGQFTATVNGEGRSGAFGGSGGTGIDPPNSPPSTPPTASGTDGASGRSFGGVGGSVQISALTDESGSVGGLSLGDTSIDVTGTINFSDSAFPSVGGTVSIVDGVDDSNGGLRFASLEIDASGDTTFQPASVFIESSDSPIVIDGNLSISAAGDIRVATTGTGGIRAGGFIDITSQGSIEIEDDSCTSFDCPTDPTISAASFLSVDTAGNFLLLGSPTLLSDDSISINAGGSITGGEGSGYRAPGNLALIAGGDITVRNAEVGSIEARAGQFVVFDPETESTETRYRSRDLTFGEDDGGGRIAVDGSLFGLAGGDVMILSATELTTGFGLSLVSGDDILVGSGATLTANVNSGSEPGAIELDAGGVTSNDSPVAGNVASLILRDGSSLESGSGGISLLGGAIDARGASLAASDISVDVRTPPASGAAQLDDNDQLSAPCLEGDICLGGVTASGQVLVGQNGDAPVRFFGSGDITATSVSIRSRETLTFGSTTSPATISASGPLVLESQAGDVELLGGAALSGGSIDISAGASLIGNGSLFSAGDIGITVGDSVTASNITAAGQLTGFGQTGGDPEALFSVPGSFTVTALRLGADAAISAGGDIVVGSANLGGNDIAFDAGGLVSLGTTSQVDDIALSGDTAAFGALSAGGDIAIDAVNAVSGTSAIAGGALSIDGATIDATTLRSSGAMALTSSGATTLRSATSGASLTIGAGALSFDSLASTGSTSITAGSVAGGDIAAGGSLAIGSEGSVGLGTASAGTTLTIDAVSISAGSLSSGSDTSLTGQTVDVAGIDSGGGIDIAADTASLGTTTSVGLTRIDAGTLTLSSANAGGGLELIISGAANIGSATSGAQISIASGDLTFDSLTSAGATSIDASRVSGGEIDAGDSLTVTSGSIDLGNASAGSTLTIDGSSIAAGALSSGGDTVLTAETISADSVSSGGRIDVTASGNVALGSTTSTGITRVGAGTLTLSSADATGGLELAVADAATLGTATSGADIAVDAGTLAFSSLTSAGATSIDAGSVSGGDIVAGTSLSVLADGAIGLGAARAGTTLSLNGGTISTAALTSGGDMALSASTVTATTLDSDGRIDIAAPGAVSLGSTRSTGLTRIDAGTLALLGANATGGLELAITSAATLGTVQSGAGVTATAGDLRFTAIDAAGDIAASAAAISGGDATSTAGAIALTSSGATAVGQLRAGTDVSVSAPSLTFAGIISPRNVTLDIGTLNGIAITAGQDLTIRSVDSLTFGTIGAGRNVSLSAANGALTITTDIDAGGTIALSADAIAVRAAGALRVNSASADNGDIAISTDGLLRVDSALAVGDIALTSTANSLIVGTAVAGDVPNVGTALNAGGTSQGTPGPGAIALAAANDITLLGRVDANTSLAARAGGLIDQRALAVGKTVAYRSADIAIGQAASLGQSNFTTGIVLTNTATSGAMVGDVAGTTAGYRLDSAEFGRIHSGGDLSLAGGSSLTVGTLAASAAGAAGGVANGNIGANSTLALSTSGELAVNGALSLANAGGNTVRLTSNGALFVDAGSGSVRLVEGSAGGGSLAVSSGSILAMTPAARTAIVGLDTRALDQRLAMSDGVSAGRTLLEAGAITISSGGSILIQNTSPGISFDERRGFVAGSLSLITRSEGGSNTGGSTTTSGLTDIVINGTVGGLTGLSALRAVQIDGSFSDFSTINGCRIVSASCGTPQIDPIRDLLEEEVEVGSSLETSADGFGQQALIVIDRIEPAGFETVIDEPVTGAGNDDLLVPEAGAGDEQCTEEDKTKCDKPPAG